MADWCQIGRDTQVTKELGPEHQALWKELKPEDRMDAYCLLLKGWHDDKFPHMDRSTLRILSYAEPEDGA